MPDEPLAAAMRRSADDASAFVEVYDALAMKLLGFFARRTYDNQAAFDLMAETMVQAYVTRHRFRGHTDDAARAWLYTIARRQLARFWKKLRAERKALDRLGIERPTLDDPQLERIEQLADLADMRAAVHEQLEDLSEAHREALHLRVVEELSYRDVAERLGLTEQTARARVSRGLRALATALETNPPKENHA